MFLQKKKIYLVGMPGSGKSTVAKALSEQLGIRHSDLDAEIERFSNQSIQDLLREEGEGALRLWERLVLRNLPEDERMIVATGGGTPAYQNNMEYMLQQGLVIYLKCSSETLLERLTQGQELEKRPLLSDFKEDLKGLQVHLQQLQIKRSVFYETAHISVTHQDSTSETVEEIVGKLQEFT